MEVGMHEAKTQLSKLVERAEAGEDVVITRHGTPAARLVAVAPKKDLASVRGIWRGQVSIADGHASSICPATTATRSTVSWSPKPSTRVSGS